MPSSDTLHPLESSLHVGLHTGSYLRCQLHCRSPTCTSPTVRARYHSPHARSFRTWPLADALAHFSLRLVWKVPCCYSHGACDPDRCESQCAGHALSELSFPFSLHDIDWNHVGAAHVILGMITMIYIRLMSSSLVPRVVHGTQSCCATYRAPISVDVVMCFSNQKLL